MLRNRKKAADPALQGKRLSHRFYASRPAMMVASVIIAVVLWFVISISVYSITPRTIHHIPLKVEIAGTSAEENGLSVMDFDVKEVTVQIEGNRTRIGNLNAGNLVATAKVENVTAAGKKSLAIEVSSPDNVQFNVKSITPSKVNVTFDRIETFAIEVRPSAPNITFAEGCVLDEENYLATPSAIDVTGPQAQLEQVAYCTAETSLKEEIDTSKIFTTDKLSFYDEKGALVDDSAFQYDVASFSIAVPVLYQQTLDITYQLTNAPANFDTNALNLELSENKITLAAPNAAVGELEDFNIGSISLRDIDLDYSNDFVVDIPEGYVNQSGFSTANLSLNSDGLMKKDFVLSDIGIVNAPSSYHFNVLTQQLTVSIVGPEEIVQKLDASDITANVDLISYSTQAEATGGDSVTFNYSPTISCPRYNNVWAVGDYRVAVQGEKVPAVTAPANANVPAQP